MNNIIIFTLIVLACNYHPLNANTIPLVKQLNTRSNRQQNVLVTFPVTKIINAQKLNNFGQTVGGGVAKNNFDTTVIDSIVNTNELLRNFLNSIDFDKIFDRFDTVSLGKVLRYLFKLIFPNGVSNKLTDALCNSTSTKYPSIKKSTTQTYTTSTTEVPTYSTTPFTPDPLYYRTTEKSKQFIHLVEPTKNIVDENENYDEILTDNLTDLKEEPVTDDYIADQPSSSSKSTVIESLELKKTKRQIENDINEMSLLTWIQSLFAK